MSKPPTWKQVLQAHKGSDYAAQNAIDKRLQAASYDELCGIAKAALADKVSETRQLCAAYVLAHLVRHRPLEPIFDPLVSLRGSEHNVRAIFAGIPEARRTTLLERALDDVRDNHNLVLRYQDHLIDLAPSLVRWQIAYDDQVRGDEMGPLDHPVWNQWKKLPEIKAAFAARKQELAARPKPKPVKPAKKPPGRYTFKSSVFYGIKDDAKANAVVKKQAAIAAAKYVGGVVRDMKHFKKRLAEDEDLEQYVELCRWTVFEGKTHVIDAWVVFYDNGTFFEAGTTTPLPVSLVQGNYVPTDKKPASKQLAADLAASAPFNLWKKK